MSVKIQDWNRVASQVVLVAQGPDGKPALLSADKPAGSIAEKPTYTGDKITKVEYFSTYNPVTKSGTVIATKNIGWVGDDWEHTWWS